MSGGSTGGRVRVEIAENSGSMLKVSALVEGHLRSKMKKAEPSKLFKCANRWMRTFRSVKKSTELYQTRSNQKEVFSA